MDAGAVREQHKFDEQNLNDYLSCHLPGFSSTVQSRANRGTTPPFISSGLHRLALERRVSNAAIFEHCLLYYREGRGFEIAQGRLGPGRIHHCMRAIGTAENALQLMCARAAQRTTFGKKLYQHEVVAHWIAESRIAIEQARLLTLRAAKAIDTVGSARARKEIAMIKVVAPRMACQVADRAIQVFGAAGVCQDSPLSFMYTSLRALRIADGPDEVHLSAIAKMELMEQAKLLSKM
ncbi:hypothetical protein GDO78_002906 [Eleutherodactylus coqui]|uniref:Acyl-CoA dehydrogenase/oxidase C-terminal domain-containing protein n=1 Tax=Eleutherodactylus coqui TaxID=57060 RepID=A0A8J6K1P3_ELECQ|nr:hypothetical protein GDO78_002906 [Eleutherodactylus coqui]